MKMTRLKKENLLFWGSMIVGAVSGIVTTAFEKAWIAREVEEQINKELEK